MKRFWDRAEVAEDGGEHAIRLDGRPVRLPGGGVLRARTPELAAALAAEWQAAGGARGGEMRWDDVPLTRLVGTALERIAPDPAPTIAAIAAYGGSDLLCYRAEEPALAAKQARAWNPWLDWARRDLGAALEVTEGVMPRRQPPGALAALERAVARHDAVGLSALGVLVPALGSLVLGLAVTRAGLPPTEAHELSLVDERHQESFWGLDAEAEARRARIAADIAVAARLAAMAGQEGAG